MISSLHRHTEWEARDAKHGAARVLVFSEDALQQLGSGVRDLRLIADVSEVATEDRVYTVISGVFYIGLGEFDASKLDAYLGACEGLNSPA